MQRTIKKYFLCNRCPGGGRDEIFDNLAASCWLLAGRATFRLATLCRPNSENEKTGLKLGQFRRLKSVEKDLDRSVDRSVELHLGFCLQQNAYGGWGPWLRDASRGSQGELRRHRARSENPESLTTKDTHSTRKARSGQAAGRKGNR